jgi:hypothetical protein
MTISALPTPPTRSDPTNFAARADAFMLALPTFVTEANALGTNVDNKSTQASADAATAANASVVASAAANFKGLWSSLSGALNMPASVYHLGQFWALSANLADVTVKVPGTAAEWLLAKTINALPAFTATGAITGGQPVSINADGTVSVPAITSFSANTESTHTASSYYPVVTFDPASGKLIRASYSSNTYLRAQVGTINAGAGTISWGAESANISSGGVSMTGHAIVVDTTNNKVVVFYQQSGLRAAVGTISGTTISFGTPVNIDISGSGASMMGQSNAFSVFDVAAGKILFVYRDGSSVQQLALGTVSGTSISFGSPTALSSNFGSYPSLCYVPSINGYIVSGQRVASIVTVSGATITLGAEQTILPATVSGSYPVRGVYCPDTQQVAFVYYDTSTYLSVVMASVSATSLTMSAATVVCYAASAANMAAVYHPVAKKLVIVFTNAAVSNYGAAVTGSLLKGYFEPTAVTNWKSSNADYFNICYSSTAAVTVATYGTNMSRIITPYFSTAQDFIGFAQTSVSTGGTVKVAVGQYVDESQTALTTKTKYYVADNGTLGTAITPNYAGIALGATKILVKG